MKPHRRAMANPVALLASRNGIALIMVLWALTILSVLVFSFSLMARTETHSTASFKTAVTGRFLAEAGVERGIMEILYRNVNKGQAVAVAGMEVLRVDGTLYAGTIEKSGYTFRITDESGKIPLNALTDTSGILLKNLLKNLGYQPEEADTVVDSVLDWRDQDELHRLSGAESDYYMSLPNPYKAKNGKFDTLEELLLVKGVTPAMLYGDGTRKGIIDFLTVYSNTNAINVNAAPKEVLAAIPGMSPEKVDYVLAQRAATGIQNIQDIAALVGESFREIGSYLSNSESNTFEVEGSGSKEGGGKGYTIKAIVKTEGGARYRYAYYKSPAKAGQ
jgi:general secretion pathway protein K